MTIGERIRRLREAKGIGQRRLAKMAGINHQILNRIELSEEGHYPSMKNGMRLAKALGVTLDYLCGMYDENIEEPENKTDESEPATLAMAGT